MRNGPKGGIILQAKEDVQADFAQSYEMLRKVVTTAAKLLILHNHAKLVKLVRKSHFVVKLQIA